MSVHSFDQLSYRSDVSDQLSQRSFVSQFKGTTDEKAKRGPHLTGNLKLLDTIECSAVVMCCRFSPDGTHLAVGLNDGSIKIYGNNTQMLYSLSDEDTTSEQQAVTQIRFLPNVEGEQCSYEHRLMATYASALVKFWHYTSGKCLHTINEARKSTLALAVSPDNSRFLTAGYTNSDSNQIHLYDMESRVKLNTMEPSESKDKMDGHTGRVFAMQYHPTNDHIFISGGWDDTVQYWDDRDQHSLKRFPGPHICGDALDIDPVHNHILTGSWRKNDVLQIWDFAMAVKIKDVPQDSYNNSQLYCAQWLGKDSIVCGGNDRNMACVIDRGTLNTTGMLVDLPQGVYCIDNDRHATQPRIAIGADRCVYRVISSKHN